MPDSPASIDAIVDTPFAVLVAACACGRVVRTPPRQLLLSLRARRLGTRWDDVARRLRCDAAQGGCGRRGGATLRVEIDREGERLAAGPCPAGVNPMIWTTAMPETRAHWARAALARPPD